jgi:hypothetical protein
MRKLVFVAVALAGTLFACHSTDSTLRGGCPSGRTCGYSDHHYDSTFYCPPRPLIPGGGYGFTWRDPDHCHQECVAASSSGCDASGCDASCATDSGTGEWLPCTEANGGTERSGGCFLAGSGVNGEQVPCECR